MFQTDEKKSAAADEKKHATATTTTDPQDKNRGEAETKPYAWPRYVFKRGTGRLVDEKNGRYEAETRLVHDQEELSRLGDGWLNTPKEATLGPNVTNANAVVTYNEDGTVAVEPKPSLETHTDRNADLHRRTMIDAEENPKPRLDKDTHSTRHAHDNLPK